jgi:hypothetical protein
VSTVMDTGRFEEEVAAGRDGLRTVRPAPALPRRRRTRGATTEAVVVIALSLVEGWESAYRAYGQASEALGRLGEQHPGATRGMACASAAVALAWRRIAGGSQLPWWMLAAVESAAEAFEEQARDWDARHDLSESATGGAS